MSRRANHQLIHSSASREWYTPGEYIRATLEVMGGIDLDPASCEEANAIVGAARYYTALENGWPREWPGRVFLNPPYGYCHADGRPKPNGGLSAQAHWSAKLIDQYRAGTVSEAILLVNANTGELWFRPLWGFPICFAYRRIKFIPGKNADPKDQPTKSNCFVYFGQNVERFAEVFQQFGRVVLPELPRRRS